MFLTKTEIKFIERGLGFVSTLNLIKEADFRRNFEDFSRKMSCRFYFRNEPFDNFSNVPAFRPKSQ